MKIVSIIGARPQFIKASVVSLALKKEGLNEILIHTGQHYDTNMNDIFFQELGINPPAYNLGVSGGMHGEQTGKMIIEIEKVLTREQPDMVVLYGDTNSTLAGTIASSKLHIPIAHVEAGLRSFNMKMPEEVNRILTDRVSSILFTPTEVADLNLQNEGVDSNKIFRVGDVMYDASLVFGEIASKNNSILNKLNHEGKWVLATIHRAENTNDKSTLKIIFNELEKLSNVHKVVLPLHPRTKKSLQDINYNFEESSIKFIDPVGYFDMLNLEREAALIITDSGGVQKEAYFNHTRCLIVREETEWVELVDIGFNQLMDNTESIAKQAMQMIEDEYDQSFENIYGNGDASKKIATTIKNYLNEKQA